jgi:hypothetical protein
VGGVDTRISRCVRGGHRVMLRHSLRI